jgi:hypothetical protein
MNRYEFHYSLYQISFLQNFRWGDISKTDWKTNPKAPIPFLKQ